MVARGTQGLFGNSVSDCWVRTSLTSARPLDRVFHTRVATGRDCKKQGGTHHQHQHSECSAHLHYPGRYRGSGKLVVEVVGSVKIHCRSGGTFERERGVDPPWSGRSASCAILRLDLYMYFSSGVCCGRRMWPPVAFPTCNTRDVDPPAVAQFDSRLTGRHLGFSQANLAISGSCSQCASLQDFIIGFSQRRNSDAYHRLLSAATEIIPRDGRALEILKILRDGWIMR